MRSYRPIAAGTLLAIVVLVSAGGVSSQDKKDPPKTKGQIPTGWAKLNLDPVQKQSIYSIQAEYKEKIGKLEAEIRKLEAERYRKMVGVLTPEQKKQLPDGPSPDPELKTKGGTAIDQ